MRVFFLAAALALTTATALATESGTRTAQCLFENDGVHYMGGRCTFVPKDGQGSFEVLDNEGRVISAEVRVTGKGEGNLSWRSKNGSKIDLGQAYQADACWQVDKGVLCAWSLNDPVSLESTPPEPDPNKTVFYGSRVGMYDDILSKEGINSTHAVIQAIRGHDGAVQLCRQYGKDYSKACIDKNSSGKKETISADCHTGKFLDFSGNRFQFMGKNKHQADDNVTKYMIKYLKTGEILDGSGASGYGVEIGIFSSLCPAIAPYESD